MTTPACAHWNCDRLRGNNGTLLLCSAHQQRKLSGLPMDPPVADKRRGSIVERVLRRLPTEFTDECFEWPGQRNGAGYGTIRIGPKGAGTVRVTNVVFEHFIGPIPDTHRLIRHTCHNPPCVNPNHLVTGNDAENMRDKMLAGRAGMRLTPAQAKEIRDAPKGGVRLAEKYGVSYQTVKVIRRGKTWGWLD